MRERERVMKRADIIQQQDTLEDNKFHIPIDQSMFHESNCFEKNFNERDATKD